MGSRSEPVLVSPGLAGRLFHFVMIKPTHYDDDGYPILWYRSAIPSNTLACLNGLAEDAHRRNVLGPDVEIRLHTYDETNRRAQPERIIREIRNAGGKALIGLVGVQSNQDRVACWRLLEDWLHHPGRHAVPQDPEFYREGRAGRCPPSVHWTGEHQP